MVVTPISNVSPETSLIPDAGELFVVAPVMVHVCNTTLQLSSVTGVNPLTTALQLPLPSCIRLTSAGHEMVGFSSSITSTFWVQFAVLPASSSTIHVTVVIPTGNG